LAESIGYVKVKKVEPTPLKLEVPLHTNSPFNTTWGLLRHLSLEPLFLPSLGGVISPSITEAIVQKLSTSSSKDHVIALNGGCTQCKGFVDRVRKELEAKMPGNTFEFVTAEDGNLAWKGASMKCKPAT